MSERIECISVTDEDRAKRITEAGLKEIEQALARQEPAAAKLEEPFVSGKLTQHLVDELRRLRGLIVAGALAISWIEDCDDDAAWDALKAEAEAIRKEQE